MDRRAKMLYGNDLGRAPVAGPLNLLSGATAVGAYSSARRLSLSFTNAVVRLRRDSDDAERDFCANSAGNVDVAEVTTFAGAGNVFIARLYDQSGNGFDFTQATKAAQPQWGSSFGPNSRSAGRFDATDDALTLSTGLGMFRNVPGATVIAVARSTNAPTTARSILRAATPAGATTARVLLGRGIVSGQFSAGTRRLDADTGVNATGGTVAAGTFTVDTGRLEYAATTATMFVNGTSVANNTSFQTVGSSSDTDSAAITMGALSGAQAWDGDCCELIAFASALSTANRQAIERNMGAYYGLTVA